MAAALLLQTLSRRRNRIQSDAKLASAVSFVNNISELNNDATVLRMSGGIWSEYGESCYSERAAANLMKPRFSNGNLLSLITLLRCFFSIARIQAITWMAQLIGQLRMDTRTKLLISAERLYALYGQAGATSRMIVAEAKQRNASALTYHFATRKELFEAICKFRMEPIDRDRTNRIVQYLAEPPKPADRLRSLIGIAFLPSVLPITEARGKSYFRRFMAQAITNPSTKFSSLIAGKYDTGLRQASVLMCREITHLPEAIAANRITRQCIALSAILPLIWRRAVRRGPWMDRKADLDTEIELLIDGFVGFMQGSHNVVIPAQATILHREDAERALQNALL